MSTEDYAEDTPRERKCLLCGGMIAPEERECGSCEPLTSSAPRRPQPVYDTGFGIPAVSGIGTGVALIILGVVAFVGMWIAGWIWPWALLVSVAGIPMVANGLKEREQRDRARRQLQKRRHKKARSSKM